MVEHETCNICLKCEKRINKEFYVTKGFVEVDDD